MSQAKRDQNFVPTLLGVSNVDGTTPIDVYADPVTHRLLVDIPSGAGTVSSVSVVTANGFAGTVATATTTPAITLSTTINAAVLAGNGTAIAAATTTGSGSTVVLATGPSISGATITTSTVNGVTLTTGGSATAFLNGAGAYTTPTDTGITQLTGDVTAGPGSGSQAATLATVNSNVGTFGSATQVGVFTVNGKGLITAASNTTVTPAVGSITGLGTGVATWLATPSSANLASAVTDETGSGALVFGTSPTIGGSPVLSAATNLKLTVPTADPSATGITTNEFNSGYSSTAIGDLVYLDSSATWQKADADASAATYSSMLGIALSVAASGAAVNVLLQGFVYAATPFPTFTIGAPIYMSATAGAVTQTAPVTTDSATRVIGYGVHADKMYFNPSNDWITHT